MTDAGTFQVPARVRYVAESAGRAVRQSGPERESALLVIKSAIAGTIAWILAYQVIAAEQPTFAPFSAVLIMQPTIAASFDRSARYVVGVLTGIAMVAVVSPLAPSLWLVGPILLVALAVGRWHHLGSQGVQVSVAAMFVYGAFVTSADQQTGYTPFLSIGAMVLLGSVVGVVTNLLVAPPLRYRGARQGIETLSQSMADLFKDMSAGLEDGVPGEDETEDWRRRADGLPDLATQTYDVVEHVAEMSRFNPRRLLTRGDHSFAGYRVIVNAYLRMARQLRSVTADLHRAAEQDEHAAGRDLFLRNLGALLGEIGDAAAALGQVHSESDVREVGLTEEAEQCRSAASSLGEQAAEYAELQQPHDWLVYGALYADADRLVDEVEHARDGLDDIAGSHQHS